MKVRQMPFYETNAQGQKVKRMSSKWYAVFVDWSESLRRLPLLVDKKASTEFARKIERLNSIRAGGDVMTADLTRYVETMPPGIRKRLAEWGILSAARVAAGKPLVEHLADWKAALLAKGNTENHAATSAARVRRIIDGCAIASFSEVSASKVQKFIAELRRDRRGKDERIVRGISAASFNYYLRDARSFFRWMVHDGRTTENPLAHLQGVNARTDRRHDRRALSLDELRWLLDATQKAPERFGMTGEERAMLYRLAVETGLRAGELRSLTRGSFDLEGNEPSVSIEAAYAKNRRHDTLPLRSDTTAAVVAHLSGKMPTAKVFPMPAGNRVVKMFRADLADGRRAWLESQGAGQDRRTVEESNFLLYRDDAGRVADFHALRHTFISNLAGGGVHPKTAQRLARHSTITLTMDRYTHLRRDDLAAALDVLPNLSGPLRQAAMATGTDGKPLQNRLSPDLSLEGEIQRTSVKSGGVKGMTTAGSDLPGKTREKPVFAGAESVMGGAGIEPATHGFSVHCCTHIYAYF
jgi:integrase